MNCAETLKLLDAHADGELDLLHDLEIERHVAGCPSCQRALASLRTLRTALADPALRYPLPPGLTSRVAPVEARAQTKAKPPIKPPFRSPWPSFGLGVAFACAAFLLWNGWQTRLAVPAADDALASAVLASHVRALMVNHLMDVPSTDQHTVKPWFNGKLDFSPPVQDFATAGFPLIGGRLDYLAGRPVAALVYKRRRHIINLFIWPANSPQTQAPSLPETRQGYHLVHWEKANSNYWAVSDLGSDELEQFVRMVQAKG